MLRSRRFTITAPLAGGALVLVLLAHATLATSVASGSSSGRSVTCMIRGHSISGIAGSRVLSTHGEVILYRVRGRLVDTVWACTRGHGRGAAIGRDESYQARAKEYGPELTLGPVQVARNWVIVTQEKGAAQEAACIKYMGPCPGRTDTLVLGSATTGLTARPAQIVTAKLDAEGNVQQMLSFPRVLLSPAGAAVWLEESRSGTMTSATLFGCLASTVGRRMSCAAQKLAEGPIDSGSLALAGIVISWTQGGLAHSATIQ